MTRDHTPRCVSIATSDSGGGAGIQADIRAFAAAGCHGATVVVGVTAQNTRTVTATYELPPWLIAAQLDAVLSDIGADAVKTGALLSRACVEAVAAALEPLHRAGTLPPLVIDPVMCASSGAELLSDDAVDALRRRLLPLAAVVTPNRHEAKRLAGSAGTLTELATRIAEQGAHAVVITASGSGPDHLFDGERHIAIDVPHVTSRATHGSGCTHSATLCARLAHGDDVETASRTAAAVTAAAIAHGLDDVGGGDGPVDVIGLHHGGAQPIPH